MSKEQRIRGLLFYLSVVLFLAGLPVILSSALGYKFDTRTFRFTKAGLVALKTQPAGASVYLGKKLLDEKTPLTINELLPGLYRIKLELEGHYPWAADVNVEAGKVTRLDKIILFPLRLDVEKLNKDRFLSFWIDQEAGALYYITPEDNSVYRSDLGGENAQRVVGLVQGLAMPVKWKASADGEKLLCFNSRQIAVAYLKSQAELFDRKQSFVFNYSGHDIINVFWHSDSYHLVVVTSKNIEILEARQGAAAVSLINLNKQDTSAFYDIDTDTLYFLDSQVATDGNAYDNIYKMELGNKLTRFRELLRLKPAEQKTKVNGVNGNSWKTMIE